MNLERDWGNQIGHDFIDHLKDSGFTLSEMGGTGKF